MIFYQTQKVTHIDSGKTFYDRPYALCGRYLDSASSKKTVWPKRRLCLTCRRQLAWQLSKVNLKIVEESDD